MTDPPFREPTKLNDRPDATSKDEVVYEFFHPFVHIEGRYEWCRILSPTHGAFNVFIVLGESTSRPATVYVDQDAGEHFMRDRYPTSDVIRVDAGRLLIDRANDGFEVTGSILADEGPVKQAFMRFIADPDQLPRQVPYGGDGAPIWGEEGRTCWGVDLVVDAEVEGVVALRDGEEESMTGEPGILTIGSFGRIGPR